MTENEAKLTEIPASEILDKIQKGEDIELDGHNIRGDLDFSQLDLQEDEKDRRIVALSISMKNCGFYGELYFSHSNFKKQLTSANLISKEMATSCALISKEMATSVDLNLTK